MKITIAIDVDKMEEVIGIFADSSICPSDIGLQVCEDCNSTGCWFCWKDALMEGKQNDK